MTVHLAAIRPRPVRSPGRMLAALAAPLWAAAYGVLGLWWSLGGPGFPFGPEHDPGAGTSLLGGLSREVGAPILAGVSAVAAGLGAVMARGSGTGAVRTGLLAFAMTLAAILAVVVPDYRVLAAVAYTPVLLAGAPFGWPPGVSIADAYPWPVVNQLILVGGGLLWACATVDYRRRTAGACRACGRMDRPGPGWDLVRLGPVATAVAVAVPVVYAATRWAWALGIPLGVSDAFLREGQADGRWVAGAALGTVALVGAALTVGLVRPWGEVVPRWVPILGGRVVPIAAAVVPPLVASVLVASAGLTLTRMALAGGFGRIDADFWGAIGPEILWPLWGLALAVAAVAYAYRRRGPCAVCGRGERSPRPR